MATTSQHPQSFQYGHSSILVSSDDFEDGYFNGLLSYPGDELHPLTDTALFAWIIENILDMRASNAWNTGYLLGSLRRLLLGKRDTTEPDAPQVQLGSVTLRLNTWRFREGFYTGLEEAHVCKNELFSQQVITAHDILSSVAHRDPETGRYVFTETEINAVEDTVGQVTGYLCAALFPPHNVASGSLQQPTIIAHEA